MNQEQPEPVSKVKQKYKKSTLRVYGTVGELTSMVGDHKASDHGQKKGFDKTQP